VRLRPIEPRQRIVWDLVVFTAIVVSAFEIPYSIFVGYSDHATEVRFDLFFMVLFGLDILFNCHTIHERNTSGFWGWRTVVGAVPGFAWVKKGPEGGNSSRSQILRQQPQILWDYLSSPWFLIDILAAIPWAFLESDASLLGLSRLLRLIRLARLLRFLRLTKAVRYIQQIQRATEQSPALGRLLFLVLSIPWLAHLHACVLYYAENSNPASGIHSYREALLAVYMTFARSKPVEARTDLGFWVGVSGILLSILFISTAIGNFAAFFTSLDRTVKPSDEAREHHILILGWNSQVFGILDQLFSMPDGGPRHIVLLSERPAASVYLDIGDYVQSSPMGELEVIEGSPLSATSLARLSPHCARSVIVLSAGESSDPTESTDLADVETLKTILTLSQAIRMCREKSGLVKTSTGELRKIPVVATVSSQFTATALTKGLPNRISEEIELRIVDTVDVLSRVLAQVIAEPELALVFTELLSFRRAADWSEDNESSEIYCHTIQPGPLVGKSFDQLIFSFSRAAPIGYFRSPSDPAEEPELFVNPFRGSSPATYPLKAGDVLIYIADTEGDFEQHFEPSYTEQSRAFAAGPEEAEPRTVLLLGSDSKWLRTLKLLGDYLPAGSTILVEGEAPPQGTSDVRISSLASAAEPPRERRPRLTRRSTESMRLAKIDQLLCCDTVALVSGGEPALHDARVLMSLTTLFSRSRDRLGGDQSIVVELIDIKNRELVEHYGRPRAIVSSEIISNLVVQLESEPLRARIYKHLLDPDGNEIYVRSPARYLEEGEQVTSFSKLQRRARSHGELAIGYVMTRESSDSQPKSETWVCPNDRERPLHIAGPGNDLLEKVLVIAED
jgi:ion transport protein